MAIPEESPSPLVEFDAEANLIYANTAMTALMEAHGFSPIGFPTVLPARVADIVRQCISSGESEQGVEVVVDERHFEWHFYPTPQIGFVRGYGIDLTARKRSDASSNAPVMRPLLPPELNPNSWPMSAMNCAHRSTVFSV